MKVRIVPPADISPGAFLMEMQGVPRVGDTVIVDDHDTRHRLRVVAVTWITCIWCRTVACIPEISLDRIDDSPDGVDGSHLSKYQTAERN